MVSCVFQEPDCGDSPCGHAVLAFGYAGDPDIEGGGFVLVKNSWGTRWGNDGLAYLTYTWLEASILNAQAIVAVE